MRAILLTTLLFCAFLSSAAHAGQEKINVIMSQIGNEMTQLYPYIYRQREFSSEELARVSSHLERMSSHFETVGPLIKRRSDTYQISYDFIRPYLKETVKALKTGNIDYARSRMYGISAICTSCHTQDTHLRSMFSGASREKFQSDFVFAEFNYMTRNYDEAVKYYDQFLNSSSARTELQIIKPLQRLITIYTQIKNQPKAGAEQLKKYRKIHAHSPSTRQALDGWIHGLEQLNKQGVASITQPGFQQLEGYVRQYLGKLEQPLSELYLNEDEQISRVWLRGQLYHYLNRGPKKNEIPKILYWLAIVDRSIDYNFYFSLADLYLKDCVVNHSRHPYAEKCYAEYKEFITSAYTGSGGTFLPDEIEDELIELKQKLK